ncbi:MAG: leucine-rich repeat domain-containing protein [Alphaproteobacteria bacterium]
MRYVRFATGVAVGLIFAAAPAFAQSAEDAAAWLNQIGVHNRGKPFDADAVRSTNVFSFAGLYPEKLKAADIAKLSAMSELSDLFVNGWVFGEDSIVAIAQLRNPKLRSIDLTNTRTTDATLAAFANHPTLESLNLSSTKITAEGLRVVAKIENLLILSVDNTEIGDAGLEILVDAPKLKSLNLGEFKRISRRGWAAIGRMQHLEVLTAHGWIGEQIEELAAAPKLNTLLAGNPLFMDAGGMQLGKLKRLRNLVLRRAKITDASMPAIGSLPALETLDLGGTPITDAGVRHFANAKKLASLALDGTHIGDEGLLELAEIKTLKTLYVRGTRVTAEGIGRFKALLPTAEILR